MTNKKQSESTKPKKKAALQQSELPVYALGEALRIAVALRDNYALQAATPLDIGTAIGIAPTSGKFRTLTGTSIAYGLTTGGYNAAEISLTDLGKRIVAPQIEGDDETAKREAFERPRIIKEFVAKYNGNKLPSSKTIAQNVLNGMGVPFEATERAYELLIAGLQELGYIRDINGSNFLQRPNGVTASPGTSQKPSQPETIDDDDMVDDSNLDNEEPDTPAPPSPESKRPNAIFLGHGKNKQPLEQLIKILDEYGIPHKEAMFEANAGRPIPVKVADTMRECGAAILIFTADEKFTDIDDNEVWRPSENVVHELGASSVLYDNRIIIFKEKEVSLASNYSSIGYITFEHDKLNEKGIELFRELVKFKIVNITVGG